LGGLSDAFDDRKESWATEYAELKQLLSESEYDSARASTLNAHYTAPEIISAMYKAIGNMGFSSGKILEPAMGIGNFFGMLPESMQGSKLYGVELDNISGRIAKQLYPKANIQIKGFEKTEFTSNSFDVAIGNVPFGDISIYDKDFKGSNLIHDYFFKKALDKVQPSGVIAFITSKGTLDKTDNSVRKYLAERAELLGAIRLPNNAFKKNAGTEVTSDIVFLRKRDIPLDFSKDEMPAWVNISENENGIEMNSYFTVHPEMVLGEMVMQSGRFGMETTCKPIDGASLNEQLNKAVENITGTAFENKIELSALVEDDTPSDIIPENYRNFCYAVINDNIYYREGSSMLKQNFDSKKAARIKGMTEISQVLQELISLQKEDAPTEQITAQQHKLNTIYDSFTEKYGLLSEQKNKSIFRTDDTSALLLSLENIDDDGKLISKADIFSKRTIVPYHPVESVDTPSEALAVSISEKAGVDLDYMSQLCSKSTEYIIEDLKGVIFENPVTGSYETADEYLSGNVRDKLEIAKAYAETDEKYAINVQSLTEVQPEDLKPEEISARLGSTWIPTEYFEQFMYELLDTPKYARSDWTWRDKARNPFSNGFNSDNSTVTVAYDESTATYGISNKMSDRNNIKANITYGTSRMNAYRILEDTLNLKTVKVTDTIEDNDGKKRSVVNQKETELAQSKQKQIKQAFQEWIFDDNERTQDLCRIYNEKFNSTRPREYDGSHLTFGGINPEIKLRKHQIDAIAHTIYGGNTLLAHSVGAGKTFEMVASAMESKRLGLCNKSMIVVPKNIVNQVAKEFLQLYPTANILVPNEKDFSKANREKFCSRIATGNYDAIIISHTQLEKIPLSQERQVNFIKSEIDDIVNGIEELKEQKGEKGFSVKQMEATKKKLLTRLEKLNNDDKRDSTITFEELGVDKLYVDEAHLFKNLYFNSKMTNVSGINTSSISQRATDLYTKCRYLDEITGNRGLCFSTGTPISNSMSELYTMQNYLQHDKLKQKGLANFDAWASTFGETVTDFVLAPEGTGFQQKTRFARFFNLPELMSMFKEVADIKTADELNLPVPKANYHNVITEASEWQKSMVDGLAERAKAIRDRMVDASVDNMLNVTNDGRKVALDHRLADNSLPDVENSKVNSCVNNVFDIWQKSADKNGTQMIFCDLSTPHYDGSFNIYDDIKSKLIAKGIPENEIAFIHDCSTDEQKQALFTNVRDGKVRVLIGSTSKMGTGTNCQDKLLALHHIDCPWRPSDLEQRNGRIIRQGNTNSEVDIYNYVTKGTFDAYLYQLVENKQRFISQIMTSKSPVRSAEDVDETVLSYAQIKAIATGNPLIKEKMDLEVEVASLRNVFAAYQENKRNLQANIAEHYPAKIQELKSTIKMLEKDEVLAASNKSDDFTSMVINGVTYTDKKEAGTAFKNACLLIKPNTQNTPIGEYRGFSMYANYNNLKMLRTVTLKSNASHIVDIGSDIFGNITRLNNALDSGISVRLAAAKLQLEKTEHNLNIAEQEVNRPFAQLQELRSKEARLDELNTTLSSDSEVSDKAITTEKQEVELN
jgi:N12 class adenine-specific DNA methylase